VKWLQPDDGGEGTDAVGGKGAPPATGDAAARKAVKRRKREDDLKFEVTWPEEVSERGRLLRDRRRKKRGPKSA
jgi:hypothetical protein